jgi:hypothetical protein
MPDQPFHFPTERENILASILKSRFYLRQLECDLHDTVVRSRETISQSQELIAKTDKALARSRFLVPPWY